MQNSQFSPSPEDTQFKEFSFKSCKLNTDQVFEDVINKSMEEDRSYSENDFGLNDCIVGEIRENSGMKLLIINMWNTYRQIKPKFTFKEENKPRRNLTNPSDAVGNNGKDNIEYNWILYVGDEIESPKYTYVIIDLIGQGISGQVFKAERRDSPSKHNKHNNNSNTNISNNNTNNNNEKYNQTNTTFFALKIIKNKKAYWNQALVELKILELWNKEIDKNDQYHIIRIYDYFYFYEHLCIVFELLNENLYQLLQHNHLQGISWSSIRFITKQILEAVEEFHKTKIIHCDWKPENIWLKIDKDNPKEEISIKVTDFGSACWQGHTLFNYIQSRYYRAPEVMLGVSYGTAIDIWSIGCIAAELYLGGPILPGSCEFDQLKKIEELFGDIPEYLIFDGRNFYKYYKIDNANNHKPVLKDNAEYFKEYPNDMKPKYKIPFGLKSWDDLINVKRDSMKKKEHHNSFSFNSSIYNDDLCAFIHFLKGLLQTDPKLRWNAKQCLRHPFITKDKLDKFISFYPDEISQFMYWSGESTQIMDNNRFSNNNAKNPYHSMMLANSFYNYNNNNPNAKWNKSYNMNMFNNMMSSNNNNNFNQIGYNTSSLSLENSFNTNVFVPNLNNIQMNWVKNFPYAKIDQCNWNPNYKQNANMNHYVNTGNKGGGNKLNNTFMTTSFEKIGGNYDFNSIKQSQNQNQNQNSNSNNNNIGGCHQQNTNTFSQYHGKQGNNSANNKYWASNFSYSQKGRHDRSITNKTRWNNQNNSMYNEHEGIAHMNYNYNNNNSMVNYGNTNLNYNNNSVNPVKRTRSQSDYFNNNNESGSNTVSPNKRDSLKENMNTNKNNLILVDWNKEIREEENQNEDEYHLSYHN